MANPPSVGADDEPASRAESNVVALPDATAVAASAGAAGGRLLAHVEPVAPHDTRHATNSMHSGSITSPYASAVSGFTALPAHEVRRVLERAQALGTVPIAIVLPPHDAKFEPTPMSRARPVSDGEDTPFVDTPHEVRMLERMAAEQPRALMSPPPPRMVPLVEEDKGRLLNRVAKAFALLAALAAIIGGVIFWVHDSRARAGSRVDHGYSKAP